MSEFKDKCGDVLTGGATAGEIVGVSSSAFRISITSAIGAKAGWGIGTILGIISNS